MTTPAAGTSRPEAGASAASQARADGGAAPAAGPAPATTVSATGSASASASPSEAAPAAALLAVRNLHFAWPGDREDVLALDGFALAPGRRLFVHGPSGCGKSTLLGLLAGVLVPRQGEVKLLGEDWSRLPAAARDARRADHVGVIFQQFNLLPYLSALDNVLLPCRFSRRRAERAQRAAASASRPSSASAPSLQPGPQVSAATAQSAGGPVEAARELLRRVALPEALWTRPARMLSVGQQQRVAAARALIGAPELVIADEPTSALDAALRDEFMALLLGQCEASGASLVFVSHDERLAEAFDERLDLPRVNRALKARGGASAEIGGGVGGAAGAGEAGA